MSNFRNSTVTINGKGNHVGDSVTNHNSHNQSHNYVTNMYREPPRDGGRTDSEMPAAIVFCALAAWQFFRHYEQLISAMQQAAAWAVLPSLVAAATAYARNKDTQPAMLSAAPAIAFAFAAYLLLQSIEGSIPPAVGALAMQKSAIQFWQALSDYGRQLVLQNATAMVFVLMATASNALAGLRTFATTNFGWFAWLWKLTWRNSPRRHIVTQMVLLGAAGLFTSGKALTAWHWFQHAIRAIAS
ncbi:MULTISPECIES: hypothetical protein [unclassified Caballeronia]|uniref:hypothetical protein n=1 Tax=unclassified Caballeronia TaxID=2646786 RepID=UPI0028574AFB|nr:MULTISPECIES: hypothetical protein [unclassified Caballeronia]MDR5751296.1 hypothetical protein [Caballeronia sp. LZ024]MDR5844566.1 hypothetical protein [Caballeronia sp. LZ031]